MGVRRGRYRHRDGSKEGDYRHRDGSKEREIQTQRWE